MEWLTGEVVSSLGALGVVLLVILLTVAKIIRDERPRARGDEHFADALKDAREQAAEWRATAQAAYAETARAREDARMWERRAMDVGWSADE